MLEPETDIFVGPRMNTYAEIVWWCCRSNTPVGWGNMELVGSRWDVFAWFARVFDTQTENFSHPGVR